MRRLVSLAILSLFALPSAASAQRSRVMSSGNPSAELGVDASLSFELTGNNKLTSFDFPAQQIRAGFYLSPAVSIEPTFGLVTRSVSGTGGGSFTLYTIGTGLLYHFQATRSASQVYARPFINIAGASGGGSSETAFTVGAGLGIKVPMADRLASRFEGNLARTGEHNGVPSLTQLNLLAGISVYTH